MFWFLLSAASPSHCTLSTQSQAKILFYTLPSAHLLTALCVFRTVWSFGSSAASHSLCSLHSHQNPFLHTALCSVLCVCLGWFGVLAPQQYLTHSAPCTHSHTKILFTRSPLFTPSVVCVSFGWFGCCFFLNPV